MSHLSKKVPLPAPVVLFLLILALSGWAHQSAGAEIGGDEKSEASQPENATQSDFTPGTKVQFQAGALYRFAGSRFDERSEPYLVTLDLNIPFNWDRKHSTWGAGIHAAFDGDGGPRVGPKVIWRTPMGLTGSSFFQLGACIYLFSSNDQVTSISTTGTAVYGQAVMPGFYFESEVGVNDIFSIVAAMEAIDIEYSENGKPESYGKTTDMHYYIGGKIGGWAGGILLGIGVAVVGISMANSFN